ncbi:MAG: Rv3654c family TadE-like protein [Gordonia sp. (in: high G+C Gram-positive bacteria)]|uniref:Rv3654c family TadE-like protein n=1 Tax=Gordonia aichiensis TaxID=36820 RepID=UPI003264207D
MFRCCRWCGSLRAQLRRGSRRSANEDGFSTVAGAAVIAALAVLLVAVLYIGGAVVARHRAQSAADLAALAGASVQVSGSGEGCEQARRLAARQEGAPRVVECTVDGDDVQLRVAVTIRLGRWGVREATALARAGPVEPGQA